MDSCKFHRGESKWILALGREFLTLADSTLKFPQLGFVKERENDRKEMK